MEIKELVEQQRAYFETGKTKNVSWRIGALVTLKKAIVRYEKEINQALLEDLKKSGFETYMCETGMVLSELSFMIRHLRGYARPKRVLTPLAQFHAKSFISPEPYGVTLVMSPWNYPFMLAMEPVIGAIAAGNCVVIKPSAYAPATSQVIDRIVRECFAPRFVTVVQGGRKENEALLEQRFDFIFFTGSVSVGKLVMEKASRYLTPVCLELGGKSPCIVDETANLKRAAARIVFGKFLNLGQTCVAPDYIFVHEKVKDKLLEEIQRFIRRQLGDNPLENENYGKIINEKHFNRLLGLMKSGKIYLGGEASRETLQIAPTVLVDVKPSDPVMQEEIFGPILPVLTFRDIREVITFVQHREKPLALYLFTRSKKTEKQILLHLSFGGGCINDTIIHLATSRMGFGGVGASGMGSYHGKRSFQTFSHERSIVKKYNWLDLPIRYQPYKNWKEFLLRIFLR
ncbi:MAG TPA: aldehyde dehydrogenase [Candidatus Choladousia intestinigallinarum]|nr:aldehyde dehydrogenase [Candidatus Choladousia intestinigallinarum]